MFSVVQTDKNVMQLVGRFDASQVAAAKEALSSITTSGTLDLRELEYISSAGLGVLLMIQKRLGGSGEKLKLVNVNQHIRDILRYAGFDKIFQIED